MLPDLERLVREHPLRERFWAHLMLARYRSGRQAEALDAFRQAQEPARGRVGSIRRRSCRSCSAGSCNRYPALQLTGKPLRGYRLLERVGEGAFGVVWRALDPELGQRGRREADPPAPVRRPQLRPTLRAGGATIARLEHPHVVPLYDYWRDGSGAYLVMRWMRGGSLEDVLVRSKPDPSTRRGSSISSPGALAGHRAHTVHRDVKPANVLLDDDGNAYLSDFGIAEDLADWRATCRRRVSVLRARALRGEHVTPSADIFALGMIAQDLVNGRAATRAWRVIGRATADDPEGPLPATRRSSRGRSARPGSSTTHGSPAPSEERNPYKGLHSFVEADADDFFGRDALIDGLSPAWPSRSTERASSPWWVRPGAASPRPCARV